ncbi:MAG: AraC family transcriptional regulator [Christensenellaceae bacterium]|nr:AraC family transcriptional regulator [Christensenellaceae bacterium]
MQSIRVYEMPACRMVSSGKGMLGEGNLALFEDWFSQQKRSFFPKDFLYWAGDGFVWLYLFEDGMTVPPELEVIDFEGGLYAVATDIDQQTDTERMKEEMDLFLSEHGLERDPSRFELGNIITSPLAQEIMGFEQMNYYTPIQPKR